jgi:TonB-dependent SusC/RagA subfamily outer membrane receptor
MKARFLLLLSVSLLFSLTILAQSKRITGRVTDETGKPVEGASVTIKGTKTGVAADGNGTFTIDVKKGDILAFSATNFTTKDVTVIDQSIYNIALARSANIMEEVFVTTALGIKRKSDALSYATQGLGAEKLTTTRTLDINNALAGKIAGVQVRSQSAAKLGSSSSIRLRGAGSIVDKNPLYVVDGTPIDDINALNIDDIDDVQVLKGPAATALYGQRADAGVILMTTKKGKRRSGLGVELNSSVVVNTVGILPKYQNEYAGGSPGVGWQKFTWDPTMPAEWKALDGQKYHTYYDDASWGPKMDGSDYIPWYAWTPGSQYSFKTAKITPQPDNVRDFYQKGIQLINNISFLLSVTIIIHDFLTRIMMKQV